MRTSPPKSHPWKAKLFNDTVKLKAARKLATRRKNKQTQHEIYSDPVYHEAILERLRARKRIARGLPPDLPKVAPHGLKKLATQ